MARKRLLWHLFPAFLLTILVSLMAVSWYVSYSLRDFHLRATAADLEARARLLEYQFRGQLLESRASLIDALCKELGERSGTRITLVLPSGKVLGDSLEDPARMDNHATRPEIAESWEGKVGSSVRFSHTVGENMMYVALPVLEQESIVGSLRVALPLTAIDQALQRINLRIAGFGLMVALLAVAVSLWLARRISRPLEEMKLGAERFARGELGERLAVGGSEETERLAEAMNQMARDLNDRIQTVLHQRNEIEAVLASMVEGVLAVDNDERILRVNRAAAELLAVDPEDAYRRPIQEVTRKADLQRFVGRVLQEEGPVEDDLVLHGAQDRHLQAHGTLLRGSGGGRIGALVVLNDVTRLRRLETIRRDFVANVSHELKTPITAIKGFVETLLDGAVDQPRDARRFLEIIIRQTERLNAIIEDLLNLSRIEQESERDGIALELAPLGNVLRGVQQACAVLAQGRQVQLVVDCPGDLKCRMNPPLLEQAVTNLVDNAIKYSPGQGKVLIEAETLREGVAIRVRDWGCGIDKEHLPRLFERFYRVDKARSRKQGGTGLGLAIVKHIVQAHGGDVQVSSTPGAGSTFTILLPGPFKD